MTKAVINIESPLCSRILEVLSCRGPMSIYDLAPIACTTHKSLASGGYLRILRLAGLIHVGAWRKMKNIGGNDMKLWAIGPGPDAPKPRPMTNTEKCRHHRRMLTEMFGKALARKMYCGVNYGGADKIVIDGRVIYQRKRKHAAQVPA